MKPITFTSTESKMLAALAAFGLLIPNGIFIYFMLMDQQVAKSALTNPISLVFITEAFLLMFLFAWLIRKVSSRRPSGFAFILMSLLGSMVFSVPAALYLMSRSADKDRNSRK